MQHTSRVYEIGSRYRGKLQFEFLYGSRTRYPYILSGTDVPRGNTVQVLARS